MKRIVFERCYNLLINSRIHLLAFFIALLLPSISLFGQNNQVFIEHMETDLTKHYRLSSDVKDDFIEEKFGKLHRQEGFLISDVIRNGTLFTKNLSKSGEINFNSDATKYLNSLKDYLLTDYPEVRDDINVYITFSPVLNAFATVNKNIYINIGLLARVENEAQLAYILGHEIMHVVNYHIINQKRSINEEIQSLNKSDIAIKSDFIELYKHEMSLAHEFEADFDGLNLFLLTEYDQQDAVSALGLLKMANSSILNYESSSALIYLTDSVYFKYLDSARIEKDSSQVDKKDDKKKLSTHPDIDIRIDTIINSINEFGNGQASEKHFVISEDTFNEVKEASIDICTEVYKKNFDFITTFNNSSFLLNKGEVEKEKGYEDMGYALFGLVVDKINGMKLRLGKNITQGDSVLSYLYNTEDLYGLTQWSLNVLESIPNAENNETINRYKTIIANAVYANTNDKALIAMVEPIKNIEDRKAPMRLEDIEFEVSPNVDISPGDRKEFNSHESYSDEDVSGKIGFFNLTNYHVKTLGGFARTNERKSERFDIRAVHSIMNLEEDRPNDLVCIVPNEMSFSGEDYTKYSLLNSWLTERLYFEGFDYISMYEDEILKLRQSNDVEYAMTSLRIEVNSFSMGKFLGYYLAAFLTPHYIPQIAANIGIAGSRNYSLTLVFRLEDGTLSLWDKRTSIEPQTSAQIYSNYNEVLNFLKEKK